MRRFDVSAIAYLLDHISEAMEKIQPLTDGDTGDERVPLRGIEAFANPNLLSAQIVASNAGLDSTNKRVWHGGGPFYFAVHTGMTWRQLYNELLVLRQAIESDLETREFVFIPPDKARILREAPQHWADVWNRLPETKFDTEEAYNCYALERNTAAVFHSMRIAEFGLRRLGQRIGVRLKDKKKPMPIDYGTWEHIITGMKTKLTALHALPKGPRKARGLAFYSDAADQCAWIKDLWRNEVAHNRKVYNEAEALGVMTRVRDFMQLVSKGAK